MLLFCLLAEHKAGAYHCSASGLQSDIIVHSENKREAVRNFADEFDSSLVLSLKLAAQANTHLALALFVPASPHFQ